ncbi:hypothetical protein JCM19037_523 [Geomicrobium sp. JCM 19037]|uniref:hypothetical protein n=1 Tax=Geomicrobium sp. JCM 19037 TaxID=1460634 RepID=UPI00045F3CF1|nr:hypothetical protein [Geomicrobium sp. JCM 19037]GAK02297.1 hypothetical protein JCM19037_523 [Geomicrobium sp. JCM 19037]
MYAINDVIVQGYAVVLGTGGVLIGMALTERKQVRRSTQTARIIAGTVDAVLPFLLIGGLVAFVALNPLMRW